MRLAIGVSVAVHAGLVLWVALDPPIVDREAEVEVGPPVTITIQAPPVEVQLLPPDTTAVAAIDPATLTGPAKPATEPARRIDAGRGRESTNVAKPPAALPDKPPLYTMRNSKNTPIAISGDFIDGFLARSKPLPPIADVPGARIASELRDAEEAKRHCHTDCAGVYGQLAELRKQQREAELQPAGGGTYQAKKQTFTAKVDPDGKIHIKDKRYGGQDALMRKYVGDPYASNKRELMNRTRDQRVALGNEHRGQVLSHAGAYMLANIQRFWATTSDPAKRKQGLFDLWDECAETGRADMIKGGLEARRVVVSWIQLKLVGPSAYTAAELAQLNAHKRSKAVFAPYEQPPREPVEIPESAQR
ncbi:MAG: hypothetical protein ABI867_38930 [Kofleriaceae bacterium]